MRVRAVDVAQRERKSEVPDFELTAIEEEPLVLEEIAAEDLVTFSGNKALCPYRQLGGVARCLFCGKRPRTSGSRELRVHSLHGSRSAIEYGTISMTTCS